MKEIEFWKRKEDEALALLQTHVVWPGIDGPSRVIDESMHGRSVESVNASSTPNIGLSSNQRHGKTPSIGKT